MADWITTKEASDLSGYNLTYLRVLIRAGMVVAEKRGRDWWVDRDALIVHMREVTQAEDKRQGAKPGRFTNARMKARTTLAKKPKRK